LSIETGLVVNPDSVFRPSSGEPKMAAKEPGPNCVLATGKISAR